MSKDPSAIPEHCRKETPHLPHHHEWSGRPLWCEGVTRDQRLALITQTLRGDHPRLPGADFISIPDLAERLANCIDGIRERDRIDARAPHQHEKWQIERDPTGKPFCRACGAQIEEGEAR